MKSDSERRFITVPGYSPGDLLNISKDRILEFTYTEDLKNVKIVGMGIQKGFMIALTTHDNQYDEDGEGLGWIKTDEDTVRRIITQLRDL